MLSLRGRLCFAELVQESQRWVPRCFFEPAGTPAIKLRFQYLLGNRKEMILDKGNRSVPPPPHGSFLLGAYSHWHLICYRLLEHFPVASETVSKAGLLEPGFFKHKTGL